MRDEDTEKLFHPSAFILHPFSSRRPVNSDVRCFSMRRLFSKRFLSLFGVLTLSAMLTCGSRPSVRIPASPSLASGSDVSPLVPPELSYARDFVQLLSDRGLTIQGVFASKLNGFFNETKRAAFVQTGKGVLEVVFFDTNAEVEQIQINEEKSDIPNYHKYVIRSPKTTQKMEGAATYFTKYRNVLIITIDRDLNDKVNQL
jgi:hypothetical protein